MNIIVIGAGAIGSLICSQLTTNKKINLTILPRHNVDGRYHFAMSNLAGLSFRYRVQQTTADDIVVADLIFICVKSFDVRHVIAEHLSKISKKCLIVLCHNGMGVAEEVKELGLDESQLLNMLTTHGAYKASARHIIHSGLGHFDLGYNLCNSSTPPRWLNNLNVISFPIIWHQNVQEKQWLKLAINSVINPLTAIHNIANGDITLSKYRAIITQLAEEISAVALSQKIDLSAYQIIQTVLDVAKSTARNTSSMRADILGNKTTEIMYINGYICRLADQYKIDTPINRQLTAQILAL